jgi:hypothetical protein
LHAATSPWLRLSRGMQKVAKVRLLVIASDTGNKMLV